MTQAAKSVAEAAVAVRMFVDWELSRSRRLRGKRKREACLSMVAFGFEQSRTVEIWSSRSVDQVQRDEERRAQLSSGESA